MARLEHSEAAAIGGFQNTQWSMVLAAIAIDSPQAQEALSRLCEAYWYPVYVFIRRRGSEAELAKDLTQEFFARLIAKQYLRVADREKGRFRTFVMACVEHFLSNERKKEQTLKRGGQYTFVSLEEALAEDRYQAEPHFGCAAALANCSGSTSRKRSPARRIWKRSWTIFEPS